MFSSFFSPKIKESVAQKTVAPKSETGVLGTINRYAKKVSSVLGFVFSTNLAASLPLPLETPTVSKEKATVVMQNPSHGTINITEIVKNVILPRTPDSIAPQKPNIDRTTDTTRTINTSERRWAQVTKRGSVSRFMMENFGTVEWWERLIDKDTGARVIDDTTDLIYEHFYFIASTEEEAVRFSQMIKWRWKKKMNLSIVKTPEAPKKKKVTSQKAKLVLVQNAKPEASKLVQKTVPSPKTVPFHDSEASPTYKQKNPPENIVMNKLKHIAFDEETNARISDIFQKAHLSVSTHHLIKMVVGVETNGANFFRSLDKAILTEDPSSREYYINQAVRQVVAPNNDSGPFQITPGWIQNEIELGYSINGPIIGDLKTIRETVKSIFRTAVENGDSHEKVLNALKNADTRFDTIQMAHCIAHSFLRIHTNLEKIPGISAKTRVRLAFVAYNVGEGRVYSIARRIASKGGTIESHLEKEGISPRDFHKRLKHIELSSQENVTKIASNDVSYERVTHPSVSAMEEVSSSVHIQKVSMNTESILSSSAVNDPNYISTPEVKQIMAQVINIQSRLKSKNTLTDLEAKLLINTPKDIAQINTVENNIHHWIKEDKNGTDGAEKTVVQLQKYAGILYKKVIVEHTEYFKQQKGSASAKIIDQLAVVAEGIDKKVVPLQKFLKKQDEQKIRQAQVDMIGDARLQYASGERDMRRAA